MIKTIPNNIMVNIIACICIVSTVLSLSSCSKEQVKRTDMQGTWVPSQNSLKWIKGDGNGTKCQIVLGLDGTVDAVVPDYLMKTSDQCSGQVMVGKGKWSLQNKDSSTVMVMKFEEVDGQRIYWGAMPLQIGKNGDNYELFFYIGGDDGVNRFEFERTVNLNQNNVSKK